jgi:hypothetical protein
MATMEPYSNIFPFNWPISPISDQKINQVKTCEIEGLSITRYPNRISSERLYSLFEPKTSCDWAVLANAYIERVGGDEELPEIAKGAFGKAISDNIGFAFSYPLFYKFFASFLIVEKPPLFEQEINKINISYKWEGIGDPVKYIIDISNANINPEIVVSSYEPITITQNLKTSVDIGILQALGSTFSNLLPIEKQFSLFLVMTTTQIG